jgi:triacylglycerol esterase/lipase EstA (alpha/beta hydrolase family)
MARLHTTVIVFTMLLGSAVHLVAQDRPVVFVHGLGSSGDTWQSAAARLQSSLAIQGATPSLSWWSLYESQASELQQHVGGYGADIIGVGHSNGGLVTRQWSRQHPVSGIVTLGSPHRGAPAVTNFFTYAGFSQNLLWSINDVVRGFAVGCCSWQWILSARHGWIWRRRSPRTLWCGSRVRLP